MNLKPLQKKLDVAGQITIICCATGKKEIWNNAAADGWHADAEGEPFNAYYSPGTTMSDDYDDTVTEARILPTGGGSNIICGRRGFNQEIAFRKERNKTLEGSARFDLPTWESLTVYFKNGECKN